MKTIEHSLARIWLVEDNDQYRQTLARILSNTPGFACELNFRSIEEALDAMQVVAPPDLLLLDIVLPGLDGISALGRIRSLIPGIKLVILTVFDDHDKVFRALCQGADGYLLKTTPLNQVERAIREVLEGGASMSPSIARQVLNMLSQSKPNMTESSLTDREREVLKLLVDAFTKSEIADQLHLSYHTVDSHLRSIYQKLHVRSRSAAVAVAIRDHLI